MLVTGDRIADYRKRCPVRNRTCSRGLRALPVRVLLVGINPGCGPRPRATTSPGIPTASGSCCTSRGWCRTRWATTTIAACPEWGLGITNLVARATPGIDTLGPRGIRGRRAAAAPQGSALAARGRRVRRRDGVPRGVSRRRPHARGARDRQAGDSKAPRSSCCRTRAAGTPTTRTPTCWRRSPRFAGGWRSSAASFRPGFLAPPRLPALREPGWPHARVHRPCNGGCTRHVDRFVREFAVASQRVHECLLQSFVFANAVVVHGSVHFERRTRCSTASAPSSLPSRFQP